MNNDPNCREVVINGDCVHGIMNTQNEIDIDRAFQTAYSLNSLINILNWRLEQKNYTPITCGIGIAYGRALMMQAGFKGSGLNEVIWMGDVVNEASNLCHQGNKNGRKAIQVSASIFNNLNSLNKALLTPIYSGIYGSIHYEGDIVNKDMNDWLINQKSRTTTQTPLVIASLLSNGRY
jgi:class 3 adenylate cyclase